MIDNFVEQVIEFECKPREVKMAIALIRGHLMDLDAHPTASVFKRVNGVWKGTIEYSYN